MKKLLLCSAAACGLALSSAPAQAQIEVTVGGHTKNYIGWLDQDEAAGSEARDFDIVRESELHFNAEGVTDGGLVYGFHVETEVDGGDDSNTVEESYLYLSGDWGRVNLGSEDGANYLLQVAAPSADSNIDGIRQYIQPVNYAIAPAGFTGLTPIDYANDATGFEEKLTYLSPILNGFQLGLSYTPDAFSGASEDINSTSGLSGFAVDDQEDNFGSGYEGAVRYEGTFNNVGLAVGAGYTQVESEENDPLVGFDSDDLEQYNVGLDLDIGAFGIGGVYTETENAALRSDEDETTYVVGVDYTTGAFKLGASYLNGELETTGGDLETDRYTGGVIYTAAEGLTFRGSVSYIEHELGASDLEATSVLGGVQLNF